MSDGKILAKKLREEMVVFLRSHPGPAEKELVEQIAELVETGVDVQAQLQAERKARAEDKAKADKLADKVNWFVKTAIDFKIQIPAKAWDEMKEALATYQERPSHE